jgi:hypothetical protein
LPTAAIVESFVVAWAHLGRPRCLRSGKDNDRDRNKRQTVKRLCFCARAAFSSSAHSSPVAECDPIPKMLSSQVTKTLATTFRILFTLEVRTRVHAVSSSPSRGRKQFIQTVRVGSLVGIRDHHSAWLSALARVGDAPFHYRRIKRNSNRDT